MSTLSRIVIFLIRWRLIGFAIILISFFYLLNSFRAGGWYQLSDYTPGAEVEFLEFHKQKTDSGFHHFLIGNVVGKSRLFNATIIQMIFRISNQPEVETLSGFIDISGCIYEIPSETRNIQSGKMVSFKRTTENCEIKQGIEFPIRIEILTSNDVDLFYPGITKKGYLIQQRWELRTGQADRPIFLYGRFYQDHISEIMQDRLAILSNFWGFISRDFLLSLIKGSLVLLIVSFLLITFQDRKYFVIIGFSLFSFSVAFLYAILVPPLQAPDEADHFLGFAKEVESKQLMEKSLLLAKRTHFERIKFHPQEKFLEEHERYDFLADWADHIEVTDIETRSPFTYFMWKVAWFIFQDEFIDPGKAIFFLRIFHSLFFGISVGLASLLLYSLFHSTHASIFYLLLLPTLPFFGMFVSDYAVLTSFYVLFSASMLFYIYNLEERPHLSIFLMGLSFSFCLMSSRSSIPMVIIIASLVSYKMIIFNIKRDEFKNHSILTFWLMFFLSFFPCVLFWNPNYLNGFKFSFKNSVDPALINYFPGSGVYYLLLLFSIMLLGFLIDLLFSRILPGRKVYFKKILRYIGFGFSIYIIFIIFLSSSYKLSSIPDIEIQFPVSEIDYILSNLISAMTLFRFKHHDYFFQTTFYGGFGWLDTIPPSGFISFFSTMVGIGLSSKLFVLSLKNDKYLGRVLLVLFSLILLIIIYAKAYYLLKVNLHGRYLIGFYIVFTSIAFINIEKLFTKISARFNLTSNFVEVLFVQIFMAGSIFIHAYLLRFILLRYF